MSIDEYMQTISSYGRKERARVEEIRAAGGDTTNLNNYLAAKQAAELKLQRF